MKLIETFRSPNFDTRNNVKSIKYIILHYTAMTNHFEAIEHLCSNSNRVSSHYLISKKGAIYYLVDTKDRAWHAGNSFWKGLTDLNSQSIGIEIDNSGHHLHFEDYTTLQINSLVRLISKLVIKFKISTHNILGHSDIAPYRKIDPGEKFPWKILKKKKIVYFQNASNNQKKIVGNQTSLDLLSTNKDQKSIIMLKKIGYDTRNLKINSNAYKKLIESYQRHYRQNNISGKNDDQTYKLIQQHYKDVLTL